MAICRKVVETESMFEIVMGSLLGNLLASSVGLSAVEDSLLYDDYVWPSKVCNVNNGSILMRPKEGSIVFRVEEIYSTSDVSWLSVS